MLFDHPANKSDKQDMQELESLKNIFKDRLFKIPDYQRGYAWATRQLKDFLGRRCKLADRQISLYRTSLFKKG